MVGFHTASSTTHTLALKDINRIQRDRSRQCERERLGTFIEPNRVPGSSLSNWPRAGSSINVQDRRAKGPFGEVTRRVDRLCLCVSFTDYWLRTGWLARELN